METPHNNMTGLEVYLLREYCKKNGIDTAEIDSSISFTENRVHLEQITARPLQQTVEMSMLQVIDNTDTFKGITEILKEQLNVKRAKRGEQQEIFDHIVQKLKDYMIGFDYRFLGNIATDDKGNAPLCVRQRIYRLIKHSDKLTERHNFHAYYQTDYLIK